MKRRYIKLTATILSMCLIISCIGFAVWAGLSVDVELNTTFSFKSTDFVGEVIGEFFIDGGQPPFHTETSIFRRSNITNPDWNVPVLEFSGLDSEILIRLTFLNKGDKNFVASFFELPSVSGTNMKREIRSCEGEGNLLAVGGYIIGTTPAQTDDDPGEMICEITHSIVSFGDVNKTLDYKITIEEENPNFEVFSGIIYNQSTGEISEEHGILYLSETGKSNTEPLTVPAVIYNTEITAAALDNEKDFDVTFESSSKLKSIGFNILPTNVINLNGLTAVETIYSNSGSNSKWTCKTHVTASRLLTITSNSLTRNSSNWNEDIGTGISAKKVSVVIPSGVTDINNTSFFNCSSLESITISNSVKSIGDSVFYNCSLTNIIIPIRVDSIGYSVFSGCNILKTFIVDSENPVFTSDGSSLINKNTKTLISYANASGSESSGLEYRIPADVTSIGDAAFNLCSLEKIIIPVGVTSIGYAAFSNCRSLTSITIPAGVTNIGESAFILCYSLTSIIIPDSVISLGDSAFNYCSDLKTVYVQKESGSTFNGTIAGNSVFSGCHSSLVIYVPDTTSQTAYKNATGWIDYSSIIQVGTIPH